MAIKAEREIRPPEVWKAIPVSDRYEISCYGRVRRTWGDGSVHEVRPYRAETAGRERYLVNIEYDGRHTTKAVLRLVAEAFCPEKLEGCVALHKNGVPSDNTLWNLVLMTRSEMGVRIQTRGLNRRIVARVDRDGNVMEFYPSCRAAARAGGLSQTTVRKHCLGLPHMPLPYGVSYRYDDGSRW